MQGYTIDPDLPLQQVSGSARNRGDDGNLGPGKGIEQTRLTGIGGTGDDQVEALANQLTLLGAGHQPLHIADQVPQIDPHLRVAEKVDLLIGKIDGRLHEGAQANHPFEQSFDPARELPLQGTAGQPRRHLRGALDQIRDGLRLGQVELAVQERPLTELAGSGRTGAERQGTSQQEIQDHRTPVPLQLQDILTGKGLGGEEKQGDTLVDRRAILGPEVGQGRKPRLGYVADQPLGNGRGEGSGDPDDTHPADAWRGSDSRDGLRCRCHSVNAAGVIVDRVQVEAASRRFQRFVAQHVPARRHLSVDGHASLRASFHAVEIQKPSMA